MAADLDVAGVSRLLRDGAGRPATIPSVEIEAHMLDDERLCDLAGETMPSIPIATRVTILARSVECDGLVTTVEVERNSHG